MKIPVVSNIFDKYSNREIKSKDNAFGNFLVNKGLYDEIEITEENIYELADLVGGHVKIDTYCPKCGENRVFSCEAIPFLEFDDINQQMVNRSLEGEIISWQKSQNMLKSQLAVSEGEPWTWTNSILEEPTRLMVFKFVCAMDKAHRLDYIVLTQGNKMKKIGQYPSLADMTFPELKEYGKVIDKQDIRELRRAIGLHAQGIGIGSFVYLRRIYERIIDIASKKAIAEGKIRDEEYIRAHVDDRTKMLSDYLPKLATNTVFYGIVSKGIHELSEEECIEYFPIMQSFIMMTLRQWEKIRKDQEEERRIENSLNNIASSLQGKSRNITKN